jgi:esterase/lipase
MRLLPKKIQVKPLENVLLIHGANSTPASFNYLKANLPTANYSSLSYDTMNGFYFNLERMLDSTDENQTYNIISHSMGGLYALHLSQHRKLRRVVSIATPFNGAAIADWARYMMPYYPLFRDVHTKALPIAQAEEIVVQIPWMQLVTTRGNVPWLKLPNDCVVTMTSMTSRKDVSYVYVNENHHEVMLSDVAAKEIDSFLFG